MQLNQLEYYIDRLAEGSISSDEWKSLQDALKQPENTEVLAAILDRQLVRLAEDPVEYPDVIVRVQESVSDNIASERSNNDNKIPAVRQVFALRWLGRIAACIILIVGIGVYLWTRHEKNTVPDLITVNTEDIQPGREGAVLTLADGKKIVLDSLENGVVAMQNGSQAVIKDGQLTYDRAGGGGGKMAYNTLTTPKGRLFSLMLSDGTRVWLNAASSLRYPTAFAGKERRVYLVGEAYFEVAENVKIPFRVDISERAAVEVLGTQFNINAYENERNINTTLLEGSIAVSVSAERSVILKPGQQAVIPADQKAVREIKIINSVDIDKVTAWKNGLFNFEEATFEEIMRQLERWYDIVVVYEGSIPNIPLTGKITKGVPLNGLLKNLGEMGVRYKLDGRTLIVLQ